MSQSRKKPPLKAAASAVQVPQNRDQVAQAIANIGAAQRERVRIEAAMNDAIAALRTKFEAQAEPYNDTIQSLRAGVQIWCEANRVALTQGGKVKFAQFASGEVRWRLTPKSVAVRGVDAVIERLKALGLNRFVRTKEEVNKENILAEPEAVEGVPGITLSQREEFVIEPFETKLEEVV